jgi:hypothetical protein
VIGPRVIFFLFLTNSQFGLSIYQTARREDESSQRGFVRRIDDCTPSTIWSEAEAFHVSQREHHRQARSTSAFK